MALTVQQARRWEDLVASLSSWLSKEPPGVFETVTVVVSSRSVARLLRQSLATSLPESICAGVDFVTESAWVAEAARNHGLHEEITGWRSARLQLAVVEALNSMVAEDSSPILSAHLGAQGSPARRLQLAGRLAHLLRRYVEWAPDMLSAWIDSDEEEQSVDAEGSPLPSHLAWQPELARRVVEALEVDPAETWHHLSEAIGATTTSMRTGFFCLPDVPTSHVRLIESHCSSHDAVLWHLASDRQDDWIASLEGQRNDVGSDPRDSPRVEVHGSHGPQRQVEILRDELCRRFDADETLEPRDVLIVCPQPDQWWPQLSTAFSPAPEDPHAHPGRSLRVQLSSSTAPNLVLKLVHDVLRLADARATASDITELLLMRPVAHRWRLITRREQVTDLVAAAEVRWGLDRNHRAMLGLGGVDQNTWMRGMDRLLAGLTLSPGTNALPITGVATVGTSDLELVGTLCELISRLRKFVHGSTSATTIRGWVDRVRGLLTELVGLAFDDEWMLLEAHSAISDMAEQLHSVDTVLGRVEFARLFETATSEFIPRLGVGNGAMHVVPPGEMVSVPFRLVCMLGIADPATAMDADLVNLGPGVPDARRQRQIQLLAHARAAEDVLIVLQSQDARSGERIAEPTAVTSLLRELGAAVTRVEVHPLHAYAETNFVGEKLSFDAHAREAAQARRNLRPDAVGTRDERRMTALAMKGSVWPAETTLDSLHRVLKDPASTFLQSTAAVRIFAPTELKDELPLLLDPLESWGLQDRLLQGLRSGLTPDENAVGEFQREALPPKLIGRAMLEKPFRNALGLWSAAEHDLAATRMEHRVDLRLDGVTLQDTVVLHGSQVVHVVASKGVKNELLPWLHVLSLAAMGVPARAVVHRMERVNRFDVATRRELIPPSQEVAHQLLQMYAAAFQQAHQRLLPVPLEPALIYAGQLLTGRPDQRLWELRTRDWDSPWRFMTPQWQLFYGDNAPQQLMDDPRTSREPTSTQHSAFGAWAEALYVPLLRGGQ